MGKPSFQQDFYTALAPVDRFGQLADPAIYAPVPDGATLFMADIVGSTAEIDAGRYKQVNVAAVAAIAAVRNAIPHRDIPFSFGGDGASFVLDETEAATGRRVLSASMGWVATHLDMTLRVAAIPVAEIRRNGLDLKIARFAVSPDLSYAMFAGGGLSWAETRIKEGAFAIADSGEAAPDLSGLSCRFAPVRSRNGIILSMIVLPASADTVESFSRLSQDLLALAGRDGADVAPVPEGGPKLEWSLANFLLETKVAGAKGGGRTFRSVLGAGVRTATANAVLRSGMAVGGFDPRRYLGELVSNTDFRKFDDGLRMTLDCSEKAADEIEALLEAGRARGEVFYGLHRQDEAMVTCLVPSPMDRNHIHFVDGAAGGYALAAKALKAQRSALDLASQNA